MQSLGQDHTSHLPQALMPRNDGIPLDLGWIRSVRVNCASVHQRAAALRGLRQLSAENRALWLCRAIGCMDLTTLSGDDTADRVRRLCAKARHPLRPDLAQALDQEATTVAAVCVYHEMIAAAHKALEGSGIPVAAVSTGFPAGLSPFHLRVAEIEESVGAGAQEIDIVISRRHVLNGNWQALYEEIQAFRAACGPAHMKVILATGDLGDLRNVARAALVAMMAGADFIKTSTGKEPVNATLPVGLIMLRMIRAYHVRTGWRVGLKPAGGISRANDALTWLIMVNEELGAPWLSPDLFRFGASSLLAEIEQELDRTVSGHGSVGWCHAMG